MRFHTSPHMLMKFSNKYISSPTSPTHVSEVIQNLRLQTRVWRAALSRTWTTCYASSTSSISCLLACMWKRLPRCALLPYCRVHLWQTLHYLAQICRTFPARADAHVKISVCVSTHRFVQIEVVYQATPSQSNITYLSVYKEEITSAATAQLLCTRNR